MSFVEIEYRESAKSMTMPSLQSHDYYEIYCLTEGVRDIFIENRVYTLEAPAIFVIPPFVMHKSAGGADKRINLYISKSSLDQSEEKFLDECAKKSPFLPLGDRSELFFSLLNTAAAGGDAQSSERKYAASISKVLIYLLRSCKISNVEYKFKERGSSASDDFVMRVVEYINCNYRENITLKLLSEEFFVSKNTLCKRFSDVMGCSVMEYTQDLRLNHAKTLLLNTNLPIEKISARCGYSSLNYFSLIFSRKVGLSPLGYRKKK